MRLSSLSKSPLILGLLFAACASTAQAQSVVRVFNITTNAFARSIDFTSDTTTSVRDMKVVREARDDAASYVAAMARSVAPSSKPPSRCCASRCRRRARPPTRTWLKPSSLCETPAGRWLAALALTVAASSHAALRLELDEEGLNAAQRQASQQLLDEALHTLPDSFVARLDRKVQVQWRDDLPSNGMGRTLRPGASP